MRATPLMLTLLLFTGLLPGQEKAVASKAAPAKKVTKAEKPKPKPNPEAVAALAKLRTSLKEVIALGRLGEKPLVKLRRTQPVKAAVSVMRMVSKKLHKMEKPEKDPGADKVTATCQSFSKDLGSFVKLADKALEVAKSAAGSATDDFEKKFLSKIHGRLYVQVAYAEITSFFVDNQAPGTFDGMFAKTAKLGREGAKAMLDLFADLDQPLNVRRLAGEGCAQLGEKADVPSVKDVHEDQLEDPTLRQKAMFVLARLGDRTAFDKEVAARDKQISDLEKKRDEARTQVQKLYKDYKELQTIEAPTAEQKERMTAVQKELRDGNRNFANLVFGTGNEYLRRAQLFLELRDHAETETCYTNTLKNWMLIRGHLQSAQLRGRVNIAYYNLACVQSLQEKTEEAMKALENSFRWGYRNFKWAKKDGDLANIRADGKFDALVEEVKSGKAQERWKKEAEAARKKAEDAKKAGTKPTKPSGTRPSGD